MYQILLLETDLKCWKVWKIKLRLKTKEHSLRPNMSPLNLIQNWKKKSFQSFTAV